MALAQHPQYFFKRVVLFLEYIILPIFHYFFSSSISRFLKYWRIWHALFQCGPRTAKLITVSHVLIFCDHILDNTHLYCNGLSIYLPNWGLISFNFLLMFYNKYNIALLKFVYQSCSIFHYIHRRPSLTSSHFYKMCLQDNLVDFADLTLAQSSAYLFKDKLYADLNLQKTKKNP